MEFMGFQHETTGISRDSADLPWLSWFLSRDCWLLGRWSTEGMTKQFQESWRYIAGWFISWNINIPCVFLFWETSIAGWFFILFYFWMFHVMGLSENVGYIPNEIAI